jgi:hypothetical protein
MACAGLLPARHTLVLRDHPRGQILGAIRSNRPGGGHAHMLLTPSQKRPARCSRLGLSAWAKPVPSSDRVAIDAAFLRLGTGRGFLQARSYARARLNKGGARPQIWDQVAGRLTEIAPVGFVLPKFQKRLQAYRFTIRDSKFCVVGIIHRGSGIAVRPIPCRDKFAAG